MTTEITCTLEHVVYETNKYKFDIHLRIHCTNVLLGKIKNKKKRTSVFNFLFVSFNENRIRVDVVPTLINSGLM